MQTQTHSFNDAAGRAHVVNLGRHAQAALCEVAGVNLRKQATFRRWLRSARADKSIALSAMYSLYMFKLSRPTFDEFAAGFDDASIAAGLDALEQAFAELHAELAETRVWLRAIGKRSI